MRNPVPTAPTQPSLVTPKDLEFISIRNAHVAPRPLPRHLASTRKPTLAGYLDLTLEAHTLDLRRLFCAPSRSERGDDYPALGARMPKIGDACIGIPCRGGLGGDRDEQA